MSSQCANILQLGFFFFLQTSQLCQGIQQYISTECICKAASAGNLSDFTQILVCGGTNVHIVRSDWGLGHKLCSHGAEGRQIYFLAINCTKYREENLVLYKRVC